MMTDFGEDTKGTLWWFWTLLGFLLSQFFLERVEREREITFQMPLVLSTQFFRKSLYPVDLQVPFLKSSKKPPQESAAYYNSKWGSNTMLTMVSVHILLACI